jgi:subtilisin family serine protease
MQKIHRITLKLIILPLLFAGLLSFSVSTSFAQPEPVRFVEDELLVQVRPGSPHDKVHKAFADNGASVVSEIPQLNIKKLKIPANLREGARQRLAKNPHFGFVEPNYIAEPTRTPNDPSYPSQWHHPKMASPLGWDVVTGSASVDIAIADSGVDPTHPDLASKLLPGYNFYDNNTNTSDVYGHGTKVAGAAAAIADNGAGVAGVAWNNPIVPLRVTDTSGYGYYSMMANAIIYAADRGIRIVNLSFGGTSSSLTLQNAIDYAWNKGTMVFASAGNSNVSTLTYPAACNHAIAVAATDSADNKSSFSNYGTWITLAAPGSSIYTTAKGGGYASVSGTSFSSPITAGVAALILSVNPLLTAQQVVDILKGSADDLGTVGFDQYFGHGRVNVSKAIAAAQEALVPSDTQAPTAIISSPENLASVTGNVTPAVTATDNVAVEKVELYLNGSLFATDATQPFSFSWDTTAWPDGTYSIDAYAYDAAGNKGTASTVSVIVNNAADVTPPVAAIRSPASGTSLAGLKRTTINAVATDNVAVAKLELYIDGALKASTLSGSLSYLWNLSKVAAGSHSIMVKAYDTSGNVNSATVSVVR